jgi:Lon protease-like protein
MPHAETPELPLFPLRAVLFPGGLLGLKVFETRYLDLISDCLRGGRPFGVVALRSGGEVGSGRGVGDESANGPRVSFEPVGTLAELISADSEQPGILTVTCRGTERFRVASSRQRADGLWLARSEAIAADPAVAPSAALMGTVRGLSEAIASLKLQDTEPFLEPHRFDDAGWVANRWCEILPISQSAKFKLMELADPLVRLQLVDDFLRSKGVVD